MNKPLMQPRFGNRYAENYERIFGSKLPKKDKKPDSSEVSNEDQEPVMMTSENDKAREARLEELRKRAMSLYIKGFCGLVEPFPLCVERWKNMMPLFCLDLMDDKSLKRWQKEREIKISDMRAKHIAYYSEKEAAKAELDQILAEIEGLQSP